jgi:hypothetical protein
MSNRTDARPMTLGAYLEELEGKKGDKPEQVRDGIEIYVGLWKKAMEKGIADPSDELGFALEKVDKAGGLYAAAGE